METQELRKKLDETIQRRVVVVVDPRDQSLWSVEDLVWVPELGRYVIWTGATDGRASKLPPLPGITRVKSSGEDERYCEWFVCRECDEIGVAPWAKFCHGCGRAIAWTPKQGKRYGRPE